jgi:integrase
MTNNRDNSKGRVGTRKAGNGEGSWFHLPNGNIRVEITVRDAKGKAIRKTKTIKGGSGEMGRKRQALKDLQDAYPDGKVPVPGQTVAECLDEWSKHYLSGVAGSTAENYKSMIDRHIRPAIGSKLLSELTTSDVNTFLIGMASTRRGEDGEGNDSVGYAKSSIKLAKKVLGMGLQHAKSEERVPENVAREAKIPEASERKTRAFTKSEVESIRMGAHDDRLEAAWLIQLGLGLRPGELLALAWEDVVGSDLHVRHSQRREGGKLLPRDAMKTEASLRVLGMPQVVREALEVRRTEQEAEQAAAGEVWENPLGLIFTTHRGLPMRQETYRRQFLALLRRAGVDPKDVTPHTFRHTTASHLVDAGVPLGTISDMLGHVDLTMLVKNYRHSTSSKVSGHVAAMDGILAANNSER